MNLNSNINVTAQAMFYFMIWYVVCIIKARQRGYKIYIKISHLIKFIFGFFFYKDNQFTLISIVGQIGNFIILITYIIISLTFNNVYASEILHMLYVVYFIIFFIIEFKNTKR
ncbi:hypothetical protein [Oceanirhabdus sp. W0125-5]|uniref:hypothetical protein n=1 Tax=Oceanirhabdus sp. W0125-5 TaxID=2999116 RepID=UPI0022F346FF|nr:hypothetical protein [Oceanirhabdus sp. W0125-5]WBW97428.1 hypothetical protein OW730_00810 [Oceanirhabdus sp. W0125-5]